jgi:hypothetical protein
VNWLRLARIREMERGTATGLDGLAFGTSRIEFSRVGADHVLILQHASSRERLQLGDARGIPVDAAMRRTKPCQSKVTRESAARTARTPVPLHSLQVAGNHRPGDLLGIRGGGRGNRHQTDPGRFPRFEVRI